MYAGVICAGQERDVCTVNITQRKRSACHKPAVLALVLTFVILLAGCTGGASTTAESAETTPLSAETSETSATAETTASDPEGMPYTNWTVNSQGSIQWRDPAPAAITLDTSRILSITIPEGYNLVDICKLLEKKGVQTFYHTFSAALAGDYPDLDILDDARAADHRRYILDGYLFPDTYQFYVGESPNSIFTKFLNRTSQVLAAYAPPAGMSMDDVINLASLIEEEAASGSRAEVSSVLHNRLEAGMLLELDMTINYVEWYIKPLVVSENTSEINAWNAYYNTYKATCPGLPAGPITNPGLLAIEAALAPATTDYLFFVTDDAGKYYFAATYDEHLANIEAIRNS